MKKTALLFLVSFCFVKISVAQQAKIDSLKDVLRNSLQDTSRINVLAKLSREYLSMIPDSSFFYANEVLVRSQKINYQKGIAKGYNLLGQINLVNGDFSSARKNIEMALKLSIKTQDLNGIAGAYSDLAVVAYNVGNLDSALALFLKTAEVRERIGEEGEMGAIYSNIGSVYGNMGNYTKALEYQLKGLKLNERAGNKSTVSNSYNNIGVLYARMNDMKTAISYYKKSVAIDKQTGGKRSLGTTYDNISNCYLGLRQLDSAIHYAQQGLLLHQELADSLGLITCFGNFGQIYDSLKNTKKALVYYLLSKSIMEKTGHKLKFPAVCSNIGNIYVMNGQYEKAIEILQAGLAEALELGDPDLLKDSYYDLSVAFEKKGDLLNALSNFRLYSSTKDSLMSSETTQQIAEMQTKYETEKKDDQIALQTAEIEKQKTIRNSVIGGVALVGIFSFLLITSRNRRKKDAAEKQMAEIEMKALRAQMNPHFIFNSLNSIMRFVKRNDATSAEDYLGKFSKLIRIILENSREQEVTLASDLQALQLYMDLEAMRLENKFQYKIEVAEGINKETVYVPPLLLQPFVENSIWHGISRKEGNGNITVRIRRENEMLKCEVEDDGVGRKPSPAVGGLGMTITGERLNLMNRQRKLKATMNVVDLEKGTFVVVSLPYISDSVIASEAKRSPASKTVIASVPDISGQAVPPSQ